MGRTKVLLKTRPHPKHVTVNGQRAAQMLKHAEGLLLRRDCLSEARLDQMLKYVLMVKQDIASEVKKKLDAESR
jgi:hypothetical protein